MEAENTAYYLVPEEVATEMTFIPIQRIPFNKEIPIEISVAESPERFYFTYLGPNYYSQFEPNMIAMQHFYLNASAAYFIPKGRLKIGMHCAICYQKVFFRAAVVKLAIDFVVVFTYDYGETVKISLADYRRQPLFWLRRDFMKTPCQALCGSFTNLISTSPTNRRQGRMMDLFQDRELIGLCVEHVLPGGVLPLCVFDAKTHRRVDIEMVAASVAKFRAISDTVVLVDEGWKTMTRLRDTSARFEDPCIVYSTPTSERPASITRISPQAPAMLPGSCVPVDDSHQLSVMSAASSRPQLAMSRTSPTRTLPPALLHATDPRFMMIDLLWKWVLLMPNTMNFHYKLK